jgi:polysaccharide export outer membrane protein
MSNKCVKAGMLIVLPLLMIVIAFGGTIVGKEKVSKTAVAPGNTGSVQKSLPSGSATDYVIGAEDVLDINVWKEPEVSRAVPVRPDGKISLPLLNDVQAAGLTPMQLGSVITEQLKKFIAQPQVTVIVTTINSRRVYVLGEVNRGGAIPLMPDMTLLQALSSAGGFTQFANQKQIYVLRNEDGKQFRFSYNYRQAVQGKDGPQNIILKPGDTIVVP